MYNYLLLAGIVLIIPSSDLEFGQKLEEGGHGILYKGYWRPKNLAVAIKEVRDHMIHDKKEVRLLPH